MEFEDQIKNINSIHFTKQNLRPVKEFLKTKKQTDLTPKWAVKYIDYLKISKKDPSKLRLFGREIVPRESRIGLLRKLLLKKDSSMPFGVRSGYHALLKHYIGITVRFFWDFMNKQEPIRKLDSRAPAPKSQGVKVNKLGHIEIDLVEVTYRDLDKTAPKRKKKDNKPPVPKKKKPVKGVIPKKKDAKKVEDIPEEKEKPENEKAVFVIFSAVERVTGLTFLRYSKTKEMSAIGKILEESFKFYAQALGIPKTKLRYSGDRGSEWGYFSKKEDTVFYKNKVPMKFVDKASAIERRNRYLQKVFHRLRALERNEQYPIMISRTMKIVNQTVNKNHGKSPLELRSIIKEDRKNGVTNQIQDMIQRYNKNRQEKDPQKRKLKPLEVGDKVRLLLVKRSKDTPLGYKSYRGSAYTTTLFEILAKTKKAPFRYKIKLKGKYAWKTRDSLLRTYEYDQKVSKYLSNIKGEKEREKEKAKLDKLTKELQEEKKKAEEQRKGRRHKPNIPLYKFKVFYDRELKKTFKIQNAVQLEKLRKKYDIPRDKLLSKTKLVLIKRK